MRQKLGITLITAWYALGGILLLLLAAGIGLGGALFWMPAGLVTMGVLFVGTLALISLALAYGIYYREEWGWYAVVILSVLNVLTAVSTWNLCGIVIPAVIIWYLWMNKRDFSVNL